MLSKTALRLNVSCGTDAVTPGMPDTFPASKEASIWEVQFVDEHKSSASLLSVARDSDEESFWDEQEAQKNADTKISTRKTFSINITVAHFLSKSNNSYWHNMEISFGLHYQENLAENP